MSSPRLAISARHRRAIARAARAAFPEECCGILLGRRAGAERTVERVIETPNVSPADRRRSYVIAPERLLEAHTTARALGERIVGFFHSHPDGGARPSRWDERDAWGAMSYLIVPRGGAMSSWRRQPGGRLRQEILVAAPTSNSPLRETGR